MENDTRIVRFGIIGPGRISRKFAAGLTAAPGTAITAVASRELSRAQAFADEFSVPAVHADYEALFDDPDVDLVYIGTVNTSHYKVTRQALLKGKGVILEKPFTLNTYETDLLIALAREKNVFLMEAMWTRFHPVNRQVLDWVNEGKIGKINRLVASFGYFGGHDQSERHLNPALGGSALLDVGIYPLSYASMFLGDADDLKASALQTDACVDKQIEIAARYGDATASLAASVINQYDNTAYIYGETGYIEIPIFYNPRGATLYRYGENQESTGIPESSIIHDEAVNGYEYEAMAAAEAFRQGWIEHPWLTLEETRRLMKQMDYCRQQIGLVYPGERAVLFDCDGVLVDSEPVLADIAAALLRGRGMSATADDFADFIGTGEDRYLGGVAERYGHDYDPTLKALLYAEYMRQAPGRLKEVEGARALVLALLEQGVKVAVASSADRQKVLVNLEALGLAPSDFDAVITGNDVGHKKPDPEIYLKAANAVGCRPEDCIVVEDAQAGILSAKAGGMEAIGLTTAAAADILADAGADHVVATIAELYALLDA